MRCSAAREAHPQSLDAAQAPPPHPKTADSWLKTLVTEGPYCLAVSGHLLGPGERLLADSETVSALTSTYLSKRTQLVRFFMVRTSSSAEAEDIVQEIFMKIAGLDSAAIENHAAFLYKLGTNVMLDRVRSKRRSEARESAYFDVEVGDGSRADPAAPAPSPEDAWRSKRRLEEVMRVLDSFPPQRRRVFTMHKIDGQSYSEVAQALGISKSAVEKHMMAALKQLTEPGAS